MSENKNDKEHLPVPGPDIFTSPEADLAEDKEDLVALEGFIKKKDFNSLRAFVANHDPIDVAYLINDMEDEADVVYLFKTVPNSYTADIFSYLDSDQQAKIVKAFTSKEVQAIISKMSNDDIADFVEELPSNLVGKVLSNTSPDDRKEINALLNYKNDTAGSIMTTEYVSIKDRCSCSEALAKIKQNGREAETISTTYVVDSTRKLVGALSLDDLIFADTSDQVDKIMDNDCISVVADTDQEDVAELMKKYDLTVIPVIDKEQRMLGIITIDDIMDVIEDEQTEDLAKMAAINPDDDNSDYLKAPVWTLSKARIPWLLFLMISDTFTELIINTFQTSIEKIPVLTVFIPMLMDTGGNAGGQTTTVVTRALSLKQITTHDILKVFFKEFRVSLIVGSICAAVNFGWICFEFAVGLIKNSSQVNSYLIAGLAAITSLLVIVFSKSIGSVLPLVAKRLKLDPAITAGPIITSIVDTCSLIIYFLLVEIIFAMYGVK